MACEVTGLIADSVNLLEISTGCFSPKLSDKIQYTTFARTIPSYNSIAGPIASLVAVYSWKNVAIVADGAAYVWSSAAQKVSAELAQQGVQVSMHFLDQSLNQVEVMPAVSKTGAQCILVSMYVDLLRDIMLAASDIGLVSAGHAFISDIFSRDAYKAGAGKEDGRDEDAKAAMHGILSVANSPLKPSYSVSSFVAKWRDRYLKEFDTQAPAQFTPYLGPTYDAVYLYAHAVGLAVENGVDYRNGREMMQVLQQVSFRLLGKTVELNENADRDLDWSLYNWLDTKTRVVAEYNFQSGTYSFSNDPIVWTGNTTSPPVGIDLLLGVIIPKTGWPAFNELAPAVMLAVDEVS